MTARRPVSKQDIVAAIKEHENTLHKDLHTQINNVGDTIETLGGDIASLTNDHNTSVKDIRKTQKEIVESLKALIDSSNGVIKAYENMGWLKRTVIEIGKLIIALTAIGGSILAAFHFWDVILGWLHIGSGKS